MKLLCAHVVKRRVKKNNVLHLKDVHSHWRIHNIDHARNQRVSNTKALTSKLKEENDIKKVSNASKLKKDTFELKKEKNEMKNISNKSNFHEKNEKDMKNIQEIKNIKNMQRNWKMQKIQKMKN